MKKITALFLALTVLAGTALVGNAYAFFTYSDDGTPVDAKHTSTNSYFGDENGNEYYRVYFFASPYYATKTEIETKMTTDEGEVTKTETLTNPLEIANHAQNPYNSKDPYSLISPELTGQNAKYANVEFSNGTKHYIIYKNKFLDKLDGSENALELYQKRDFTGYIRANPDMGIAEQTSTYVVLTVRGNLSAEQLGGIVAETVFKDKYGFGSEFIGWTYDKAATADRATYKTYTGTSGYTISKYTTKNGMSSGNTQGYGIGTGYEIGNFGCQGAIAQVTSTTSLNAIDKEGKDGSAKDDHVIYLYPVFIAKNYDTDKSIDGDGKNTPFAKFRVNADNTVGEDNMKIYEYNQMGEIDYSKNRYTVGMFQNSNKEEISKLVNYYTDNIFIGDDIMQLDICPTTINGWTSAWYTILGDETLKEFGLEKGYYNVDMKFSEPNGTNWSIDTLKNVIGNYSDTQKYIKIYSSLDVNESGLVRLGDKSYYFVIGFQKVEEFRLVGDKLNNDISSYDAPGYEVLNTISQIGEHVQYIINRVYLYEGSNIAVLTEDANGKTGTDFPYAFLSMSEEAIESANNVLNGGSTTAKREFCQAIDGSSIVANAYSIHVNKSGSYTLIFNIEYQNGSPSNISVGYMENDHDYYFIVLDKAPTETFYTDISVSFSNDKILFFTNQNINEEQ